MVEALTFCSMYLEGVEKKCNTPNRNKDGSSVSSKRQLSAFNSQCLPNEKMNFVHLDENDFEYIDKLLQTLASIMSNMRELEQNSSDNLDKIQRKEFPSWFYTKI